MKTITYVSHYCGIAVFHGDELIWNGGSCDLFWPHIMRTLGLDVQRVEMDGDGFYTYLEKRNKSFRNVNPLDEMKRLYAAFTREQKEERLRRLREESARLEEELTKADTVILRTRE